VSIDGNVVDGFDLTCDNCEFCPNEEEGEFSEFNDAVEYKKDNGWKSVKNVFSDTWSDLCPDCQTPETISRCKGIA
jgi:hypothetical protein